MNKISNLSWVAMCLYFLSGILFLIFYYIALPNATYFTQPFFMPLLFLYYFSRINFNISSINKWVVIAIVLSWLGDLFMMLTPIPEYKNMVMPGIASFLMMHLLYIKMFFEKSVFKRILSIRAIAIIGLLIIGVGLCNYLFAFLINDKAFLKIPVLIYTCIILSMVIVAVLRDENKRISYLLILIGALLFLVSDGALSIHLFKGAYLPVVVGENVRYLSWTIVGVTYLMAQFLIIEGLIRSKTTMINKYE